MGGIIPEDEEEYDDCITVNTSTMPAPIDDDIYEELPGLTFIYLLMQFYSHDGCPSTVDISRA